MENPVRTDLTNRAVPAVILGALLILTLVTMSLLSTKFLSAANILSALGLAAPLGILAIGMTIVILVGGIDLSVGSILALSSVSIGVAYAAGLPGWLAAAISVAVGALCGLINGLLVSRLGLPSIVVTIATMAVFAGVALAISGGSSLPAPPEFVAIGFGKVAGVPIPLLIWLVIFAIALIVLTRTAFGEHLYALGTNARAVRYAGLRDRSLMASAFVISGLMSGLAGLVFTATVSSAKSNFGQGYELAVVTIVVVGGAALTGGSGTLWGTVLATVVIALVRNGLSIGFVPSEVQTMVTGAALIITAILYQWAPGIVARIRATPTPTPTPNSAVLPGNHQ
jgi:rhamnose transport system permease protein